MKRIGMIRFLWLAVTLSFCVILDRGTLAQATDSDPDPSSAPLVAQLEDDPWKIEVTSFQWLGSLGVNRLGELCGRVRGPADKVKGVQLLVDADYDTKHSAAFSAHSDLKGRFCVILNTFYGRAQVSFVTDVVNKFKSGDGEVPGPFRFNDLGSIPPRKPD